MSIFVQIASYRGFDLVETVRDCVDKAKNKESLFFGIALHQDENVPVELMGPNLRTFRFHASEKISHGAARRRCQQMYAGEDYVLQVDSGMRFADNWDEELVSSLNRLGDKAIITNYPSKLGANGDKESTVSYKPQVYQFISEAPAVWPAPIKNVPDILKGRYIMDAFFFARGSHSRDCLYNQDIYYTELDAFITLLSYTKGYDIFHHNKPIVWKNYEKRPASWESDPEWWLKQQASRGILSDMAKKKIGLGDVRTLRDFEIFSGLDFENRRIQKDAASASDPPCKYENDAQWNSSYMRDHSITVSWNTDEIERCDDYDYWYFSIEDESGATLMRQDVRVEREASIMEFKTNYKKVFFKAPADKVPKMVCIWPASKSKGWLKKSKFPIV